MNESVPPADGVETASPLSSVASRPTARRVRQDLAIYLSAYVLTFAGLCALIWLRNG